jgi:hypothetical protein
MRLLTNNDCSLRLGQAAICLASPDRSLLQLGPNGVFS